MAGSPVIEIREPGQEPRRVVLTRALDVGRQSGGLDLSDQSVSRRHLRLVPSPVALSLVDLESRNGTFVKDRNSTRRNSSHANISYAVFCLKKKKIKHICVQ